MPPTRSPRGRPTPPCVDFALSGFDFDFARLRDFDFDSATSTPSRTSRLRRRFRCDFDFDVDSLTLARRLLLTSTSTFDIHVCFVRGRARPSRQTRAGSGWPGQAGPQAGPGQTGPGQAGPGQAWPGQAGPGQLWGIKEPPGKPSKRNPGKTRWNQGLRKCQNQYVLLWFRTLLGQFILPC